VALNEKFIEHLIARGHEVGLEFYPATGPADGPFVVRPHVRFIEPGFYAGVAGAPSEVQMEVRITTPDGAVLDEVALIHDTSPFSGARVGGFAIPAYPASGNRLRKDGEELGKLVAKYVHIRSGD
jgi:hypothetical protein